ncbi:hypothetical protein CR513_55780, partial [Mucuna pruriens]
MKTKERECETFEPEHLAPTVGLGKTNPNNHKRSEIRAMPITRNQASSTNEGDEDTLQRLLWAVASLQVRSDEQSRLSAEAKQRHAEAKERYRQAEERHLDAMKAAKRREEELHQQIASLRAANERDQADCEEDATQPFLGQPFCKEIDETPIPPNFREVIVEPFDGSQDPYAHLQTFQTQMYISGGNDRLSCKLFPGTLRGVAMQWMAMLPPRSIQTFKDLAGSFVSQFAANKVKKLEVVDFFDINLKNYLACFNNAIVRVDDPDQKFFVKAFQKGLRAGSFSDALALRKPVNMEEIRARAEKHVEMEEDQYERRRLEQRAERKEVRQASKTKEDKQPMLSKTNENAQRFTPLTEKRTQILHEICHTSPLEYPQEAKGKLMGKEKNSWCDFHRAFGHIIEDCWALKTQIERLVQTGRLDRYVQQVSPRRRQLQEGSLRRPTGVGRRERSRSHQGTPAHRGTITTISGGRMVNSQPSSREMRKDIEERATSDRVQTVLIRANITPLGKREPTPTISFDDRDIRGQTSGRDEPMVISVVAAKYKVERVLIDQESSANILYWATLERMQLPADLVQKCPGSLYGFAGECVPILGTVELETCFGERSVSRTVPVLYMVVDAPASYNIIIGRLVLNRLGAIVSTKHLCMKFPVGRKVGSVWADTHVVQRCYEDSLKVERHVPSDEVNALDLDLDPRSQFEREGPLPAEDLKEVQLGPKREQIMKIGTTMSQKEEDMLITLLKANYDVFA